MARRRDPARSFRRRRRRKGRVPPGQRPAKVRVSSRNGGASGFGTGPPLVERRCFGPHSEDMERLAKGRAAVGGGSRSRPLERTSVVWGKSVSGRVEFGGVRVIKNRRRLDLVEKKQRNAR